jgi:hypothetical protein
MWHVWERGEVHAGLLWGNLRERDHSEDLGVDVIIILRWVFKNAVWCMAGLICFRIGKSGALLLKR